MKDSSAPQFTGLVSIGLEVHFLPLLPAWSLPLAWFRLLDGDVPIRPAPRPCIARICTHCPSTFVFVCNVSFAVGDGIELQSYDQTGAGGTGLSGLRLSASNLTIPGTNLPGLPLTWDWLYRISKTLLAHPALMSSTVKRGATAAAKGMSFRCVAHIMQNASD